MCDEIEGQHSVTILVYVWCVCVYVVSIISAGNICKFVDNTLGDKSDDPSDFGGGFEIGSIDLCMCSVLPFQLS